MAALLGVVIFIFKSVMTLRGVMGTILLLGHEAAHDVAQRDAYFRGAGRDLSMAVIAGLVCLGVCTWGSFRKKTRWIWLLIWAVALAMSGGAYYALEQFKAAVERI